MEYFIICFVPTTKVAENVISSLNCYPSKQSSWWRHLSSSSSEDVFKTSSRRYDQDEHIGLTHTSSEDVFNTSWSRSIYSSWSYVFKTSSRRLQNVFKTSSKRLQNVFKASCKNIFKTTSRSLQDVFKTSSKRLQDIFKASCKVLQMSSSSRRFRDVSSRYTVLVNMFSRCLLDVFTTFLRRTAKTVIYTEGFALVTLLRNYGQCTKFWRVTTVSQVLVFHF